MYYSPVNDPGQKVSFYDAVRNGVSPDGQLYLPQKFPVIPPAFFHNISSMSLDEISFVVLNMLFGEDVPAETLRDITKAAFKGIEIPFIKISDNEFTLDLTKGPTGSYHDFSARIIAEYIKTIRSGRHLNVIVITNGNAANATADAFSSISDSTIYALYPKGQLSYERRGQLLLRENVVPVEVCGDYSECRRIAIETILNREIRENTVTITANSENLAILLPRVIYFFYAYARLAALELPLDKVVIDFETEHLGNLTAAVIAEKMGMPKCRLYARFPSEAESGSRFILPRMVQLLSDNLTAETLMQSAKIPPRPDEIAVRLITQAPADYKPVSRERAKKIIHLAESSAPLVRSLVRNQLHNAY